MPRPIKSGLDYFSIDCDFFSDNKRIKSLRRAHGPVGILTYLSLLCKVYGGNGYYYHFDNLEELAMDIAEEIAGDQVRRTATSVTESIFYLVEQGMLDKSLFEQGVITGVALQEQYALAATAAKRKLDMSLYNLLKAEEVAGYEKSKNESEAGASMQKNEVNSEETPVNSEETPVNSELSTQSKSNSKSYKYSLSAREREKKAYGKNGNVMLTEQEYADIVSRIPEADEFIDRFSEKLKNKGYQYQNHHKTILDWWATDQHFIRKQVTKRALDQDPEKNEFSSFDTDTFIELALKRSQEALNFK